MESTPSMSSVSPPEYVNDLNPSSLILQSFGPESDPELPAYARRATHPPTSVPEVQRTEHRYDLSTSSGKPWATLVVLSRSPSPQQLPTFLEGDKIEGSIKLDLESGDHISSISMSVRGQIVTGTRVIEEITFLDQSFAIWSKDMGDPRNLPSTSTSDSTPARYRGKLTGEYEWPFSITLPREVSDPTKPGDSAQLYRLPQSSMDRGMKVGLQYDIIVNIKRTKFRVDSRLQTMFAYVPSIRPDPPSLLRQLAYRENSPLIGPEADPEGWESFPRIKVSGTVFNTRSVQASCVLALAKPLCYTRGTTIPCILTMECQDPQALDLLCSPSSVSLCLRRRVGFFLRSSSSQLQGKDEMKGTIEDVDSAVWWPSPEGSNATVPHHRRLNGEIHIPKSLKPTSAMAHFSIVYSIAMLPFKATGFTASDPGVLLERPIEIATLLARGPRPIAYAPPNYGTDRPMPDNYFIPPSRGFI